MSVKAYEPHKSSIGGMDANIVALLTYILAIIFNFIGGLHWFGWAIPLVFFLMEKNSQLVKFHAAQSFVLALIGAIIYIILDAITWATLSSVGGWAYFLGGGWAATAIIATIVGILIAIAEVIAMINAYQNKEWSIPFIGDLAEKFREKVKSI